MTAPASLFEIRGAAFSYQASRALRSIDLTVSLGERLALLGANGSGKSTLLRLLAALSFPESGSVRFDGEELTAESLVEPENFYRFRRRVGMVFQNPEVQLFNPSVFDEVAFGPLQLGYTSREVRERVEASLEEMQIAHLRHRAPHRLSGGEKKKVALASVLVMDPEVLLLDEPAAALDPSSQSEIYKLLADWSDGRKTVVMATHDLDSLEEIADRCCVLREGTIIHSGSPMSILHNLPLLEEAGLLRPHRHAHTGHAAVPHGHLHASDI